MVAWQMPSGVSYSSWQCYVIQISVVGACHIGVGGLLSELPVVSHQTRHRVCEQLLWVRRNRIQRFIATQVRR